MSLHEQLYQWTAQGGLDAISARRLWQLSGAGQPPAGLWTWLRRGTGVLATGLIGFGVILWVAANWDTLGRAARFGLLEGLLVVSLLGAAVRPGWRGPLGLLAFLTLGGLLAYFGQTYQTGADAWTLFALWAGLAFPLALAVGSDLIWTPWVVVTSLAIRLWVETFGGHGWHFEASTLPVHGAGLGASLLLSLVMAWREVRTGQPWAWRMSVLTGSVLVVTLALGSVFHKELAPQFWWSLGTLIVALSLAWWHREVYAMSLLALSLNIVLVAWQFHGRRLDSVVDLLVLGGTAAVLLAGSVQLIVRRVRSTGVQG
ncbi:DUF2157 domain-containing protein [Roseateles sp. SL47]|uniref:DUF2157 domain-containing protein n=1 Tax=Roseateles sp. SL47 TaxID=2995138 RepID=UPI002271C39D|nr:DUF2157 domain-containing protein [Roseateles sp. SL47]WAC73701.1 DUF2157 domain-containing protein [Roseateles sp. SL47]